MAKRGDTPSPPPPVPVLNPEYMWYVSNRPPGMKEAFRAQIREWMKTPDESGAPYGTTAEGLPINGPVEWKQYYPTIRSIDSHIINRTAQQKQDFLANRGFEFIRELGSGGFGEVWEVHRANENNPANPQRFACKVLQMSRFDPYQSVDDYVKAVKNESEIQRFLIHTNIVRIESVIHMNDEERNNIQIVSYLFMELCDTDLNRFISEADGGYLTEDLGKYWFKQIAGALKYMHDRNVSHLDIKPQNIMVKLGPNDSVDFKLSDFGMAQMCRLSRPNIGTGIKGTLIYLPPEVWTIPNALISLFRPLRYDAKASDVYSLGITLLHSLSGTTGVMGQFYLGYVIPKDVFLGSGISESCVDLILRMTEWDPKKRPTMAQVMRHPWVQ